MKIVSTNLGEETTVTWKGKEISTGIFKTPVDGPLNLGPYQVEGDHINSKKYHGGIDKACYAYGENHYAHFKSIYPDLDWTYGMFGENLTIAEVDEAEIKIGDIYKVGDAIVQVSEPRQPCSKLAAKFGSNDVINQFIDYDHPGIYFRVIRAGSVCTGDELILDLRNEKALSLQQIFQLVYAKKDKVDADLAREALFDPNLASSTKKDIERHWKL